MWVGEVGGGHKKEEGLENVLLMCVLKEGLARGVGISWSVGVGVVLRVF